MLLPGGTPTWMAMTTESIDQPGRVDDGPGGVADEAGLAELGPAGLGQVRIIGATSWTRT